MGNFSNGDTNPEVEQLVKSLVESNPVVVFSKSYCPYCDKAKNALKSIGAKYEVLELDQRQDGSQIQKYLRTLTGRSTVPNVFVVGKSIGGGDETAQLKQSGQLKTMYDAAI